MQLPDVVPALKLMEVMSTLDPSRSYADKDVFGTWLVSVSHIQGELDTLFPSFFHEFPVHGASQHVHFSEIAIAGQKNVMIMSFESQPAGVDIERCLNSLALRWQVVSRKNWIPSPPLLYNDRAAGPLFRLDGLTNIMFIRKHASTILRKAINAASVQLAADETFLDASPATITPEYMLRDPRQIFIWARRSTSKKYTDLGGQVWTCLKQLRSPIQRGDELVIDLEQCSTLNHSFLEKDMARKVQAQRQIGQYPTAIVLTAWADRLTRRIEDLPAIHDFLENTSMTWFSLSHNPETGLVEEDEEYQTQDGDPAHHWKDFGNDIPLATETLTSGSKHDDVRRSNGTTGVVRVYFQHLRFCIVHFLQMKGYAIPESTADRKRNAHCACKPQANIDENPRTPEPRCQMPELRYPLLHEAGTLLPEISSALLPCLTKAALSNKHHVPSSVG